MHLPVATAESFREVLKSTREKTGFLRQDDLKLGEGKYNMWHNNHELPEDQL
jgi:hypothetical protein